MPQRFTSIVSAKEKVSSKVYLLTFKLIKPETIDFLAGQTVMFYVAPGINRSMSLVSTPNIKDEIQIAHDVGPGGIFSQWTMNAKVGDTIDFMGPLGMFTLDKLNQKNKVLIATGTGIAPFRSMLFDIFLNSQLSTVNYKLSLYWGLRYEEDIFWQHEFEKLAKKYSNFKFMLTLTKPSAGWKGAIGRVGEHIFKSDDKLTENEYYLCGNRSMVSEIKEKLLVYDVPKSQIKFELFY